MIQLFDTHRLSYRNAKLRAWALADKTRRVNFQDYSSEDDEWTSIGTDVITDESGYLFYANGTQKVECLGVEEAAIVDVSLDGGLSYLIQFVIHADHDPSALRADNIYGLTFTNDNGVPEVYNPITGPKQLPDYIRRSEYSQGDWREQTVITRVDDIDGATIPLSDFTHLILIAGGKADGSGVLTFSLPDNNALRAGQVITIRSWWNISVRFNTVSTPGDLYKLRDGDTYILHNNIAKNKLILANATSMIPTCKKLTTPTAISTDQHTRNLQFEVDGYDRLIKIDMDGSSLDNNITNCAFHLSVPQNFEGDVCIILRNCTHAALGIELLEGTISSSSSMSDQATFTSLTGTTIMAYFHLAKVDGAAGATSLINKLP